MSNENNYRPANCCRMCKHSKQTEQDETMCTQDGVIVSDIFTCDDFEECGGE